MISSEPIVSVGLIEQTPSVAGEFRGMYRTPGGETATGVFRARRDGDAVIVTDEHDVTIASGPDVTFTSENNATVLVKDVIIGINFHWQRKEDQVFEGDLRLVAVENGITVINRLGLEPYLKSVISSEMSATSPSELLKAHAITSRSWLAAMLQMQVDHASSKAVHEHITADEVVRWYDREDHTLFDVCADDHCQRYQGVSKIISDEARRAVDETKGQFLTSGDRICDARYYKACGGRSEEFAHVWDAIDVPYLRSVSDTEGEIPAVHSESDARIFIDQTPDVWCNTSDPDLLRSILPDFDQETTDFFRWKVSYTTDELSSIIEERSGMDLGTIRELEPLDRGPSGRIYRLRIVGSKRSMVVGKELEIRKWLSKSHLYSSAFYVEHDTSAHVFTLVGAGWGHGAGLCQIGAAAMAAAGKKATEIVLHYFRGAELKILY